MPFLAHFKRIIPIIQQHFCILAFYGYICTMNNRNETPYRLQRDGFDEIIVGWERVYELTPRGMMDKVIELSLQYDKAISVSFPEWWKSDREADLPALMLNNIFGIIPYYDYNGCLTWVRVVNLATNETIKDYPGTEDDLLFICKHILTDCKKILRSWGKEPYRELRYGTEWLRDPWHKENYQDAFQRLDVRTYDVIRFNRLSQEEYYLKAYRSIRERKPDNDSFYFYTDYPQEQVFDAVKDRIINNLSRHFQDNKPADLDVEKEELGQMFWFLIERETILFVCERLARETLDKYGISTYIAHVADAIVPFNSRPYLSRE